MRNFLEVSRPCRHSEQSWPANRRGLTVTCCMFIPAFQKGQGGAERKKRERRRRRKKSGVGGTNTAPPKSRSQHVTCNVSQRHVVHGAPSRRTHPTPVFSPPPPPLPPPKERKRASPAAARAPFAQPRSPQGRILHTPPSWFCSSASHFFHIVTHRRCRPRRARASCPWPRRPASSRGRSARCVRTNP